MLFRRRLGSPDAWVRVPLATTSTRRSKAVEFIWGSEHLYFGLEIWQTKSRTVRNGNKEMDFDKGVLPGKQNHELMMFCSAKTDMVYGLW